MFELSSSFCDPKKCPGYGMFSNFDPENVRAHSETQGMLIIISYLDLNKFSPTESEKMDLLNHNHDFQTCFAGCKSSFFYKSTTGH